MALNLINLLKDFITPEVISKASTFVGENEHQTAKAVDVIVPTILAGLLNKAQDENGLASITNLFSSGANNGSILNNVLNIFNGGEQTDNIMKNGTAALSKIFGDNKIADVASVVSTQSGVQTSAANKLLSLVTPLILGLIGKQTTNNDTSSGLAALLFGQKDLLAAAAPAGLAGLLGLENLSGLGSNLASSISDTFSGTASTVSNTTSTVSSKSIVENTSEATGGLIKWLLPIILIIAAIAALFFGMKSCKKPSDNVVISDSTNINATTTVSSISSITGKLDTVSGDWIYDLGNIVPIKLPNGTIINVGEHSTEAKLVAFLSGSDEVDTAKGNWFEFTNVRFKTGSNIIIPESQEQLKNFVKIAKAFPTAQFKIGGYTDNTGDSTTNVALSQKRADAVSIEVANLGIAKTSIIGAKGFGSQWPIADNETPEGKAQNRRVAVNVKAK